MDTNWNTRNPDWILGLFFFLIFFNHGDSQILEKQQSMEFLRSVLGGIQDLTENVDE